MCKANKNHTVVKHIQRLQEAAEMALEYFESHCAFGELPHEGQVNVVCKALNEALTPFSDCPGHEIAQMGNRDNVRRIK